MNFIIAGGDIVAAVVMATVLVGIVSSTKKYDRKLIYFIFAVTLSVFFSLADGVSFILDELGGNAALLWLLDLLSYIGVDLIMPAFVYYSWTLINERSTLSRKLVDVISIGCLIDIGLTLYSTVSGNLFTIVDGRTVYGPWANFCGVTQLVLSLYFVLLLMFNHKKIHKKAMITVTTYFIYILISTVIEILNPTLACAYIAIAMIFLVVYISIVAEEIQAYAIREQLMKDVSETDALTGLYNRHAYEEYLKQCNDTTDEDNFVYISMDVNGLKVINDNFGHAAGDELIQGAATCMQQCFGAYGNIYRIGGDEFAAIIYATDDQLVKIKEDFDATVLSWRGQLVDHLTISSGYVPLKSVETTSIHEISLIADRMMYQSKNDFYRQKGIDRRGQKDAHVALCALYTKILKIDITEDSYQIIDMDFSEQTTEKGFAPTISAWLKSFGMKGQVHPDDLEDYLSKTSLAYMRDYFTRDKTSLSIFYRRKYRDGYKQVMMEIIPASDYTNTHQTLFLYVKNIDR